MKTNYIIVLTTLCLLLTGCEKEWLDVNVNPSTPTQVTPELLLSSGQFSMAWILGGRPNDFLGAAVQHVTSNRVSEVRDVDQWFMSSSSNTVDNWQILYDQGLPDLKNAADIANAQKKPRVEAIAKVSMVLTFAHLTDLYGDIPFTDALQGDKAVFLPKYDKQEVVYDGMIKLLNEALVLLDQNATVTTPTIPSDLVFNGNMTRWRNFANTLKLRLYMRLSAVSPDKAKLGVATLKDIKLIASNAEEPRVVFNGAGTSRNFISQVNNTPLTSGLRTCASITFLRYLQASADPRLPAFFEPMTGATTFSGTANGNNTTRTSTLSSTPGRQTPAAAGDAPVVLMSYAETLFLQAEAAERGWLAGDAKALYDAAIGASVSRWGLPATATVDFLKQKTVDYALQTNKLEAIAMQKWVALYAFQEVEAYCELRRTGFPKFSGIIPTSSTNANNVPVGQLVKPLNIVGMVFPRRMVYPSSERLYNTVSITATGLPADDTAQGVPVWWDKTK